MSVLSPTSPAFETRKAIRFGGTYRSVAPEQTWERVQPLFTEVGITRVADVTGLDDIGIPVWQAVRPNCRNLSVSQGKGVTALLAKVSAAMESFELHCAEETQLPRRTATLAEASTFLGEAVNDLPLLPHAATMSQSGLQWCQVANLSDGGMTWWPERAITVDYSVRTRWSAPLIRVNSNGIASGNTLAEASLHGLLELIERHSLALSRDAGLDWGAASSPRPGRHSSAAAEVTARLHDAGVTVQCLDITSSDLNIPTFIARVWSPSLPRWYSGSGSHLDADVALARALTEAVQSRVTAIAGAREDIAPVNYDFAQPHPELPQTAWCDVDELIDRHHPARLQAGMQQALEVVVSRCASLGVQVFRGDLTRAAYGIPVVRMVAPGLIFAERHGHG